MPKGLQKIAKLANEAQARREAYDAGGDFQRALVLKEAGQTATGRFLEEGEGVTYVYVHDLPLKPGQKYADKILCLDQDDEGVPCYSCQQGIGRTSRLAVNFIRFDEPKLKRGTDGKSIKDNFGNYQYETTIDPATNQPTVVTEPALVLFITGTGAGGRLAALEEDNGGMTRHVCKIRRTADNTNPYMIDIVEKNKLPPAPWEIELFNKKVDPLKGVTQLGKRSYPALSFNDMARAYGGSVASGFATDAATGEQAPVNTDNNIYAQAAANHASGAGTLNLGAFGS